MLHFFMLETDAIRLNQHKHIELQRVRMWQKIITVENTIQGQYLKVNTGCLVQLMFQK